MTDTPKSDDAAVCAFTIDVEGFAESHAQSVRINESYLNLPTMDREIEENLDVTLDMLEAHQVKATFFFLGRIAHSAPKLVRRVSAAGHEIGCHSLNHVRITGQSREEFRRDLRGAKSALEDAAGVGVIGFRAPDFSIGNANEWAFDELAEAGFAYDSSVVPTSVHDVYGMLGVSEAIFRWPNGLVEFPMPVKRIWGREIPCGGGGYFRLFPLSWTLRYFRGRHRRAMPTSFYIHPYEVGPVAPRLPGLSLARRFRHYIRLGRGTQRIPPLLRAVPFTTMAQVLTNGGFLNGTDRRTSPA